MNKFIQNYKKTPTPIKASLWFLFASIIQNGISFITVPIFTRLLSAEDFGKVNVYQSWLSIITIVATLSLWGGVFNNGMIKYEKDRSGFITSMQGLATLITIGTLIIFILFYDFLVNIFDFQMDIVVLMFLQINFSTALSLWSSKQKYAYKYKKLVLVTLIIGLANPILGLILVYKLNDGGLARIISIALVQICIGLILYINNIRESKKIYNKEYWKYAFSFNLTLVPHYLSQSILNQSDRIMVNNIIGADKAGIYSIAYSVGMIILIFVNSINNTLTPWTYRKMKEKNYKLLEKISIIILMMLGASILLLISFAPEIISLMAPHEYAEAIWVVPPIALSVYFIFLYGLFANIEFYFEENKFIMLASIMTAFINIVLNLLLIPTLGYIAAAYTTLISYIIYSSVHFIFMRKIIKKHGINNDIYDLKKILSLTFILSILIFIVVSSYKHTFIRYSIIVILITLIFINKNYIIKNLKFIKN